MGRVGGEPVIGLHARPYDGDPHTMDVGGARVEIVQPWEEVRALGRPRASRIGVDLTFRARTKPYGLRRGTMRAGHELVWDQSHIFQSGTYDGTYTVGGDDHESRRLVGPARPLVGHPRPRPLPAVAVVPDPAPRRLPRRLALGVRQRRPRVHRRLLGADRRQRPGAAGRLRARRRVDRRRRQARRLRRARRRRRRARRLVRRSCWRAGSAIEVEADGEFARPYEPFHRGGLNLMRVRTDDGRDGHGDLRGHRRPPPPLLPRHRRRGHPAGLTADARFSPGAVRASVASMSSRAAAVRCGPIERRMPKKRSRSAP